MNFKDYQPQINALIPYRNKPDFNSMLDKIFFGESNSDKFLIKMELNRLVKPCTRIIDLREKVIEKTDQYVHFEITHYLTLSANRALKSAIKLYGGYTVGAYEHVIEHVQKVKQIQNAKALQASATEINENITENIELNNHRRQAAARMFFVSKVSIILADGTNIEAATSNISVTGIKVKLPEQEQYLEEQLVKVMFTALGSEYKDKAITNRKICYRLVKQQQERTGFYLYLNLEDDKPEFVKFIQGFIRANQHKYKLDVLYYFSIAREKALKNSTLNALNTLPIFLNSNQEKPILFMLRNAVNKEILNQWRCNNTNQMPFLFTAQRLKSFVDLSQPKMSTTIYSFTYIKEGEEYLLSATEQELQQSGLKHLFIEYGRSKTNWHCYHLTLQEYTYEAIKNYKLTDVRPKIFNDITHVATLTEIATHEMIEIDPRAEKGNPNLLNKFVHKDTEKGFTPTYDLFPDELRKEERYSYTSNIELKVAEQVLAAKVVDFSGSGLKIELATPKAIAKRSLVSINFIDLQKVTKQFTLANINYRVVSASAKHIYHLQIASRDSYMTMQQFFSLLVRSNPAHFNEIPLKSYKQPVTPRLHEAAEVALHPAFFYVSIINGKPKISFSSITSTSSALKQIFNFDCKSNNQNNHIPLSNNRLLDRLLVTPLRHTNLGETVSNFERTLYVKKIKDDNNKWSIETYLDEDFESEFAKREFIVEHKKLEQLQILHYRLSTIDIPNLALVKSELDIISCHAMHLSKRLEEELLNVKAIIQVIDRTEQVL
ncbi:PilZ domain-containing protein [Psychromonas sp. 14N.309.X.WAT.B.A12]|uniref:PilZ domain-containing protein n=1 Tax=unclassified Psychromonas TaxID=2614957 RepID=UPI0025B23CBE|nr:PilZ domain-containing protein [Psychromonas sp. 14N.309.X.WAT.B.A12]MDN2663237.1 PilZ domain-containing protein [Psychromonas sp. 14N.309.X.WAT.B.A12]